jgi:methionyl-tRNA synthetase
MGGSKMSKSRGRMITERKWLDSLDPSYLRYYLAANLGPGLDDIEFSLDELRNRVNSQLLNNIGNLANRALSFAASRFDRTLAAPAKLAPDVSERVAAYIAQARQAYADLNYREALKQIEAFSSWANEYMQSAEPWKVIRTDRDRAHADVSLVVNVVKVLATMLAPTVPRLAKSLQEQLGVPAELWDAGVSFNLPAGHIIGVPSPLLPPLEASQLEALFAPDQEAPAMAEPIAPEIQFADFEKIDLRVGVIRTAEKVPKADKLLKLTVDLGEGTPRTIASGIATAYAPEELVGRRVIVVANLAPRTIRGVESRGMLLASDGGPKGLILADVPGDALPGAKVK